VTGLAFPLTWPAGWKRTAPAERQRARFGERWTVARACEELLAQLSRDPIRARRDDVAISTNVRLRLDGLPRSDQRAPEDPGAAVYFPMGGRPTVLACDRWGRVEHNLRALAAHVEALRALDRYGVGTVEQAFLGYAALPERGVGRAWWEVLGIPPNPSPEQVREAYRELAKRDHPDVAGDGGIRWRELQEAHAQARAVVGQGLAGEPCSRKAALTREERKP